MNIPNALSIFRLILVPVFVGVFFSDGPNAHLWAAGVFLLAGATDILDGRIARKYNQITVLGRILDPLADKLMVMTVLYCMAKQGMIPMAVSILYGAKECLQIIAATLLLGRLKDMPPSNIWGKTATLLFYVAIAATILLKIPPALSYCLFGAAFIAVGGAVITYAVKAVGLLKENVK